MDYIEIKDLAVFANHGVFTEETILGQKFLICAKLYLDTQPAGIRDDLSKSINYADICSTMTTFFQENTCMLIESAAEKLANHLLQNFSLLQKIDLKISKPWAPIGLFLQDISVNITREWHTVYLSLGSNLGKKQNYLNTAITAFKNHPFFKEILLSNFHETKPYGYTDQPDFLNACLCMKTTFSPKELLSFCQKLENDACRIREVHWGPRTLDIDILFYDQMITSEKDLTLPHPEIEKRMFVLEPLCEINPYLLHPLLGKRISTLKEELQTSGKE